MLVNWAIVKRQLRRALAVVSIAIAAIAGTGTAALAQTERPVQQTENAQDRSAEFRSVLAQAAAQIGAGNLEAGRKLARRAFMLAQTPAQKVEAARLVASALFRSGRYSRSEIWLRRAFNVAPDAATQSILRQEFAQVRRKNPLRLTFGLSVAPSNNVNNGSSSETVTIWNLPFQLSADARALSGIETAMNVDLKYRLSESARQATNFSLVLYGRTYRLSRAARIAAPGAKGSDYSFAMAEATLSHDRKFANFPGATSFQAVAGQFWYGGTPYIRYGRASITQGFEISTKTAASLSIGYENQIQVRSGGVNSKIKSLGAGLNRKLANSNTLSLNLQYSDTASDDPTARNVATRLRLDYSFAKPLLGASLSLNLSAEKRDYRLSFYDATGRHDRTLTAGANLVFVNTSVFGFSPNLTLEASRTWSNVTLYNRQSTSVRLGIQSTF